MFTPEEHRRMAANLRATAGTPGHPSEQRAAQMALNHEAVAKMIERRQIFSPPLVPADQA